MKSSWSCCNLLENGKAVFEQITEHSAHSLRSHTACPEMCILPRTRRGKIRLNFFRRFGGGNLRCFLRSISRPIEIRISILQRKEPFAVKNKKSVGFLSAILACVMLLSGCGSFLNREYSASEPHSAAYYGSDDRSVLRIESYQDLVNALLMQVDRRATEATIWFYPSKATPNASEAMARACSEVQQETPLGAYTVDYLSYTQDDSSHNYSVLHLTIGYRRTAEQVNAIVHATSVSALYNLLVVAAERDEPEVVVQVNSFDQSREEIRDAVAALQLERYLAENPPETPEERAGNEDPEEPAEGTEPEEPAEGTEPEEPAPALPEDVQPWQVNFYPAEGDAGIVEVLLKGK